MCTLNKENDPTVVQPGPTVCFQEQQSQARRPQHAIQAPNKN